MIVLCLAGLGSRFTKVGITTPKYLLPIKSKISILRKIVEELKIPKSEKLILILNNRHKNYFSQVQEELKETKVNFYLHYIDDTQGQAETAKIASQKIIEDFPEFSGKPVIFHNGDTLLFNRNIAEFLLALKEADGLIDTFFNNAANYSYVLYLNGKVTAMAEKKVISDHASTGLYGFKSPEYYLENYSQTKFKTEQYISDVYGYMIENDAFILDRYSDKKQDTVILGTPDEYKFYMQNIC